jgi:hypothetical protein
MNGGALTPETKAKNIIIIINLKKMKSNSFKKISMTTIAIAILVAGCLMTGCQKDEAIDLSDPVFEKIALSDVPEGITPMKFSSDHEAIAYINELKAKRAAEKNYFVITTYTSRGSIIPALAPRLKSSMESATDNIDVSGWWVQSLNVYISFSDIGGNVTITSSLSGFTLGAGWEQKSYSYYWSGSTLYYTVSGDEIIYLIINGLLEIYRDTETISGSHVF